MLRLLYPIGVCVCTQSIGNLLSHDEVRVLSVDCVQKEKWQRVRTGQAKIDKLQVLSDNPTVHIFSYSTIAHIKTECNLLSAK